MNGEERTVLPPVLYAEDDENDVFFMRRAFKKAGVSHPLLIAGNGTAAVELLQSFTEDVASPRPCLAILDLKMPNLSGLDVLRWARKQPRLINLPILLLTSSTQERDLREAYEAGANAYLVKPADPDRLIEIVREIYTVCLQANCLSGWLKLSNNLPAPN